MLKVGQTAYATRKALTQGIHEVTVERVHDGWVHLKGKVPLGREGRDVFASLADAQVASRVMADRALHALEKKRAKLEGLRNDGARLAK